MSKYLWDLGVPKEWSVVDVIGFDEDLLAFLPKPVAALIFLFPVDEVKIPNDYPQAVTDAPNVYWMIQRIHNACGTIALIHSVANNTDVIKLTEGSKLKNLLDTTKDLSPEERASKLEGDDEFSKIHEGHAASGQTAPPENLEVDYHFISLVQKDGTLYELDGRKTGPVPHGPSSPESFLSDASAVIKKFMSQNPNCLRFTSVALAKNYE